MTFGHDGSTNSDKRTNLEITVH